MVELRDFQTDLLYVIAGQHQPQGKTIKSEFEAYYGSDIGYEQLYPNLDLLVNDGYLERVAVRPTSYVLTRRGWQAIQARHAT